VASKPYLAAGTRRTVGGDVIRAAVGVPMPDGSGTSVVHVTVVLDVTAATDRAATRAREKVSGMVRHWLESLGKDGS
jgi:hypothetical protein